AGPQSHDGTDHARPRQRWTLLEGLGRRREPLGDRRAQVRLDLGRGEGAVVDPNVVEQAPEVLAPDGVPAHVQDAGGGRDRSDHGGRLDERTVDVEAQVGAVERDGEVRPGVQGEPGRADRVHLAADEDLPDRVPGVLARVEAVDELAGLLLEEDAAYGAAGRARVTPG